MADVQYYAKNYKEPAFSVVPDVMFLYATVRKEFWNLMLPVR